MLFLHEIELGHNEQDKFSGISYQKFAERHELLYLITAVERKIHKGRNTYRVVKFIILKKYSACSQHLS